MGAQLGGSGADAGGTVYSGVGKAARSAAALDPSSTPQRFWPSSVFSRSVQAGAGPAGLCPTAAASAADSIRRTARRAQCGGSGARVPDCGVDVHGGSHAVHLSPPVLPPRVPIRDAPQVSHHLGRLPKVSPPEPVGTDEGGTVVGRSCKLDGHRCPALHGRGDVHPHALVGAVADFTFAVLSLSAVGGILGARGSGRDDRHDPDQHCHREEREGVLT
mmetsp:Transcript_485/g.1570  ORF Transcript_485/g.1570 Transcript_485/m.1570 type:complete len:218 (+) Transcript_485:737-1390(+)